jgi:hypothetical protein
MIFLLSLIISLSTSQDIRTARVIDIEDGFPISGAMVYTLRDTTYTDINGFFKLETSGEERITIKAMSYQDVSICPSDCGGDIEMSIAKPTNIEFRSGKH